MQRNTLGYEQLPTSRQVARCAVALSVLMTIGFCVWGTTSGSWQRQYQVASSNTYEKPTHQKTSLGIQIREHEEVRLIHSILWENSTGLREEEEEKLARFIYQEGNKQGLDPFLLVAMIQVESTFHNYSESYIGAKGLMQILPSVARSIAEEAEVKWEGDSTLFNPKKNIRIGASYLKKLIEQFNDLELALAAYNLGPTALMSHIRTGKHISSFYTEKVMSLYEDLQKRTRRETG